MDTAGCFGYFQISTKNTGYFNFAALDYTGPHADNFDLQMADFLGYAIHRDKVTHFLCVCSPPGLQMQGGPIPANPPPSLIRLAGLHTLLIDPMRRGTLMLGFDTRVVPLWFIGNRLRIIADSKTGKGDILIPLPRGRPITVELDIGNPKLTYEVTEYQASQVCAPGAAA